MDLDRRGTILRRRNPILSNKQYNTMSLKRDYILTMVEQIAQFIARLVFLRETSRGEAALQEVNEFYKHFVELDADALRALPHEAVVALCADDGALNVQKGAALASILKEEGDILRQAGREADAVACHTRALALLLEIYGDGTQALPLGVLEKLELVIDRALDSPIPPRYRWMLIRYFEQIGSYADAENLLFDLIDEEGTPASVGEGLRFYERLAAKSDEDLANGNLPREEVEESRASLLAKARG